MDNHNLNKDIVKISYDLGKGIYIKDVYYDCETQKAVILKRKADNKYCLIPKSIIEKGWKKDKKIPQNIYLNSYLALLRFYWRKNKDIS